MTGSTPSSAADGATRRILVIDDDALVRSALRRMLEGEGFAVLEARHGGEGLAIVASEPVDLVITDILMPEIEGIETILELRRNHPALPVIATSGGDRTGNNEFLDMASKFVANRVLPKPFRSKELLTMIQEIL
jgi:CheY-like chemotaxis protein